MSDMGGSDTQDGDKKIIHCIAVKKQQLNNDQRIDLRIFYWAAFNGFKKTIRYMIVSRRWSPFIKSYKNRSIISGAIWGS